MHRTMCCLALLVAPSIAWSVPYGWEKPFVTVKSSLLEYYKSALSYELRQMDIISPSDFESRHILELRAELEAWRDFYKHSRFESSHISDYVDLKQNAPDYVGREEYTRTHRIAKGSPIACSLINGFVGCHFRNGTDSNDANLFLLTVHTEQNVHVHDVYELTVRIGTFYTLRQMSKDPTWNLQSCRADAFHCSVSIRFVQIASLDAFEAQLNRLTGMIEDVEEETVRLLKLEDQEDRNKVHEPKAQEAKRGP